MSPPLQTTILPVNAPSGVELAHVSSPAPAAERHRPAGLDRIGDGGARELQAPGARCGERHRALELPLLGAGGNRRHRSTLRIVSGPGPQVAAPGAMKSTAACP